MELQLDVDEELWFHLPRGRLFFNDRLSLIEYLYKHDTFIEPIALEKILQCWQVDGVYLPENFMEGLRNKDITISEVDLVKYLQVLKAFGWGDPYIQ